LHGAVAPYRFDVMGSGHGQLQALRVRVSIESKRFVGQARRAKKTIARMIRMTMRVPIPMYMP
jgi:hypothetical protein